VVAGSGLAIGIPALHGLAPTRAGRAAAAGARPAAPSSGSCSAATNAQVAHFLAAGRRAFASTRWRWPMARDVAQALAWARRAWPRAGAGLRHRRAGGRCRPCRPSWARRAGALVEHALARIAQQGWSAPGVRQLVVAGGETSGACVQALGVHAAAHRPADRPRRAVDAMPPGRAGRCTWR
jgi:uncharacterized protein YgbK (DUF1537 family)